MKKFLLLFLICFSISSFSQEKYISRNGEITFNASTPLETISPTNNYVSCILDSETGDLVFQLKMISFKFKKALMEEHFNERYVESDKFPKATFIGKINSWDSSFMNQQKKEVTVFGKITIHGIEKELKIEGTIENRNNIVYLNSIFNLIIADFGIEIPKLVRDKISKIVTVDVNVKLKQK